MIYQASPELQERKRVGSAEDFTVSVITPVWNRPELLRRALASIRAQTLKPAEIIVVDDGSEPPISVALDQEALAGVVLLRNDTNKGAAAARNAGIAVARGNYLAFLDSDDIWHPEKLEAQIRFMLNAGSRFCTTGFWLRRPGRKRSELRLPAGPVSEKRLVWGVDLSPGSTLIAEVDAVRTIGPQDERLNRLEDWDWLLRVAYEFSIDVFDRPLTTIEEGEMAVIDARGQLLTNIDENMLMSDPKSVRRNTMLILRAHALPLAKRSPLNVMKLTSAVFLEIAASNYRSRKMAATAFYGLASVIAWPARNRYFYQRILVRLLPQKGAVAPGRARRVLHVISGLGDGGAERALVNLVLHTGAPALEHIVLSLSGAGVYGPILSQSSVEVLAFDRSRISSLPLAIIRMARLIRHRRPDVIKCWMYHANLVGSLAVLLSGRRRVMRFYWGIRCSDMDTSRYTWSLAWVRRLGAWISSLPDLTIINSFRGARVHASLGYRSSRMVVFDNGVDIERFRPDDNRRRQSRRELGFSTDTFIVGIVARVDPMKGYQILHTALRRCPGVLCVAIGSGTDKLPQSKQFIGIGRRSNVEELLPAFDVLVSPSMFGEGWSNSIAEAMAAGLPVIATDVGDAARLVGNTGIIVPPADVAALAEAIRALQSDPDRRRMLGAAARERAVKYFSLDICAARYERLLLDGVADTGVA